MGINYCVYGVTSNYLFFYGVMGTHYCVYGVISNYLYFYGVMGSHYCVYGVICNYLYFYSVMGSHKIYGIMGSHSLSSINSINHVFCSLTSVNYNVVCSLNSVKHICSLTSINYRHSIMGSHFYIIIGSHHKL